MKEDVNPKLVKNLYNKYAPNVNVDEKLEYIQNKYGDDEELFVRNFYNKYAPNVNVEEKLEYIKKNYSLKKKGESQPTSQKETTESVTKEKTERTGSSDASSQEDEESHQEKLQKRFDSWLKANAKRTAYYKKQKQKEFWNQLPEEQRKMYREMWGDPGQKRQFSLNYDDVDMEEWEYQSEPEKEKDPFMGVKTDREVKPIFSEDFGVYEKDSEKGKAIIKKRKEEAAKKTQETQEYLSPLQSVITQDEYIGTNQEIVDNLKETYGKHGFKFDLDELSGTVKVVSGFDDDGLIIDLNAGKTMDNFKSGIDYLTGEGKEQQKEQFKQLQKYLVDKRKIKDKDYNIREMVYDNPTLVSPKDYQKLSKEIDIELKDILNQRNDLVNQLNLINKIAQEKGGFSSEELNQLSQLELDLKDVTKKLKTGYNLQEQINVASGLSIEDEIKRKEKLGTTMGYISNTFYEGVENVRKGVVASAISAYDLLMLGWKDLQGQMGLTTPEDFINELGKSEDRKKTMKEIIENINNSGLTSTSTTTPQYMESEERGVPLKAVGFTVGSVPGMAAIMVNPYLGFGVISEQVFGGIAEEWVNNPDYEKMPLSDLLVVGGASSVIQASLEKLGLDVLLSKTPFGKVITDKILQGVMKKVTKGTTRDQFYRLIAAETNSLVKNGSIKILGNSISESFTEGGQQLVDTGIKALYNKTQGKPFFQVAKTGEEAIEQIGESMFYGFLGGNMMSTLITAPQILNQGIQAKGVNKEMTEILHFMSDSPELRNNMVKSLKMEVLQGRMTKSQAQETMQSFEEMVGIMNEIPSNINKKGEAFDLILEKNRIENSIKGKSEELTKPQRERITQINEELETLATQPVEEEVTEEVVEEAPVEEKVTEEVTVDPKLQERLNKRTTRFKEDLDKATTEEEKAAVIQKYKNNKDVGEKGGATVSKEDAAVFEQAEQELKEQGIEIDGVKRGDNIIEGQNIDIDETEISEDAEGVDADFTVREVSNVIRPEIQKDGKQTQRGKVDVTVRPKTIEELESNVQSIKQQKKRQEEIDKDTSIEDQQIKKIEARIQELKTKEDASTKQGPTAEVSEEVVEEAPVEAPKVKEEQQKLSDEISDLELELTDGDTNSIIEENETEISNVKQETKKEVLKLNDNIKKVRADKTLSKESKEEQIQELKDEILNIKEDSATQIQEYKEIISEAKKEQRGINTKIKKLKKKLDAISEPSTESVDVQESTRDSETVGEGDVRTVTETQEEETKIKTKAEETKQKKIDEGVDILAGIFGTKPTPRKQVDERKKDVDNARKSLSKVAPEVEIVVHETDAEYRKATGEENRSQSTRGSYNPTTKTIDINLSKAADTTVAHETFHALLLKSGINNKQAEAITSKMLASVKKVASPELLKRIEEFSNKYDTPLQSEESIAELFGILASEYNNLPKPTQNIITRWLNRLAKLLRLKSFTDVEVIDLLNTVSGKVRRGEVITEEDITILQDTKGETTPQTRKQKVFRAGDLTVKAEPISKFELTNRSTGHFGTGFYFFGKRADAETYAKRTGTETSSRIVSEIDLNNYNLAKATLSLHEELKRINDKEFNDRDITSFDIERIAKESGLPIKERQENPYKEFLVRNNREYKALISKYGEAKTKEMSDKANRINLDTKAPYEDIANDINKKLKNKENKDTRSTLVMKALGFEGINATGTDLDNSRYGTVIYDIKSPQTRKQMDSPMSMEQRVEQIALRYNIQNGKFFSNQINHLELMAKLKPTGFRLQQNKTKNGWTIRYPNSNRVFEIRKGYQGGAKVPGVRYQEGRPTIDSVKKSAEEAGVGKESVVKYLQTLGYTQQEIDKSYEVKKVTPKKVEGVQKRKRKAGQRLMSAGKLSPRFKEMLEGNENLDYTVENQNKAIKVAEELIKDVGIDQAYEAVKKGNIRGGVATAIEAEMLVRLNENLQKAEESGNENDIVKAIEAFNEMTTMMMKDQTEMGQRLSMWNKIFKTSILEYNLDFVKKKYEKEYGTPLPASTAGKLQAKAEQIKKQNKKVEKLEKEKGTAQENQDISNIENEGKREITKTVKVVEEDFESAAKGAFSDFFSTKPTKTRKQVDNDGVAIIISVGQDIIKQYKDKGVVKEAELKKLIAKGVKDIKAQLKEKGIKLTVKSSELSKKFNEVVRQQVKKIKVSKTQDIEQGRIKIPKQLLYDLVLGGVKDINTLTNKVYDVIEKDYTDLTLREVRDAITGYGKEIGETKDEIKEKIASLKMDGRQLSKLEDLDKGKRPRILRRRREYTQEQRKRIREIRQRLKALPLEETADLEKFYKSALESYKTRLSNRLADLNKAIEENKAILKKESKLKLDKEAKQLKEQVKEVQKEYDAIFKDTKKSKQRTVEQIVEQKNKRLADLRQGLAYLQEKGKEREVKKTEQITSPKIEKLNKQIKEVQEEYQALVEAQGIAEAKRIEKAKKYIQSQIKEYQERIKNKDFSTTKKRVLPKTTKELSRERIKLKKLKNEFADEVERAEKKQQKLLGKTGSFIYEAVNLGKGLLASFDFSAAGRQGIFLGSSNPKEYARAFKEMHKAVSEEKYNEFMDRLEQSEYYPLMLDMGLSITDTSGKVNQSEERFLGNWLKTPIKIKGRNVNIAEMGLKASERAYSTFLNSLRSEVAIKGIKMLEARGMTFESNPKEFKALATFINNATGRGKIPFDSPKLSKFLNTIFFSPRMIVGNAMIYGQILNPRTPGFVRWQGIKSLSTYIGYQILMKGLFAAGIGALIGAFGDDDDWEELELFNWNMLDTDFNKIVWGDTRYDTSAGQGIMLRTIARMVMGRDSTGKELDRLTTFGRFLENKLAPGPGFLIRIIRGQSPANKFEDLEDATAYDYIKSIALPLTISGLAEDYQTISGDKKELSAAKTLFNFVLNTYGINSMTYQKKKKGKSRKKKGRGGRSDDRSDKRRDTRGR